MGTARSRAAWPKYTSRTSAFAAISRGLPVAKTAPPTITVMRRAKRNTKVHVVLDDEHGDAGGQPVHRIEDEVALDARDARRGLVEQQHLGLEAEGDGQLCLRLQRPIMRDYVRVAGPTDGAAAAGGG